MTPLTVGSLFAGIGGIELGLEWTGGFKTVWQVENDEYATKVLERHWPDVRRWGDVWTFPPDTTSERLEGGTGSGVQGDSIRPAKRSQWYVDLITAGFPCQDISYAGKGAGLGGERSGLFWETARVVRILRPRYVLLENVAALLTRGLDAVLGTLASLGYDAEWHCIPAAAVGAPHIRDRVFIVADATQRSTGSLHGQAGRQGQGTTGRIRGKVRGDDSWWIVEPDVGRVASRVPSRVDRLRCLGNSVVPQVAQWIGYRILEAEKSQ